MKKIGFSGAFTTFQIGNKAEMQLFFDCIEEYVVKGDDKKWMLLTNRFYRKYLKLEELDTALLLMEEVNDAFKSILIADAYFISELPATTKLKIDGAITLSDVFSSYFKGFNKVIESAKISYASSGNYRSVKVIVADMLESLKWDKLPDEEYEAVIGEPLWSRHG